MSNIQIQQDQSTFLLKYNPSHISINKLFFKIEHDSLEFKPIKKGLFKVNLLHVLEHFYKHGETNIYIIIEQSNKLITTQKQVNLSQINVSNLDIVKGNKLVLCPYVSTRGNLHYKLTTKPNMRFFYSRNHINKIKFNNQQALIDGQFSIIYSNLKKASIVLKTRNDHHKLEHPLPIFQVSDMNSPNVHKYNYQVDIQEPLEAFLKYNFKLEDIIDVYLKLYCFELAQPLQVKVGNPRIFAELLLKGELITNYEDQIHSVCPYFTMKGRNLSFKINQYSIDSYLSYINCLKSPSSLFSKEKIWVIGEKRYKAQDNGYHFFKYMRTAHPEIPVYYIIDKHSNELANVEPFGNVVYFGSKDHFKLILKADYICATHYPDYLYPTNSKIYTQRIKATKIFLQHGVLGTKNLTGINGNQLKEFNVDLFITSSEREKEIVVRDLKFDANAVKVTGLPRFDALFNKDTSVKDQILIIPTWRDWLTNRDLISQSEYLRRMNELLESEFLKELALQGTEVVFCLHPNMQPFIDMFNTPTYIKKINQGEVNVQQLIKESSLMITDYSSVAIDFSFLNKPVIYYQFDKEQFLGKHPSHLDIENELPGFIVNNQDELEATLKNLIKQNYKNSDAMIQRANLFCKYKDTNNCERVYQEIINFNKFKLIPSKLTYNIVSQHLLKRFRSHSKYYTIMRNFNRIMTQFFPIKKDLIVFESNIGKSVSDSPKAIYDALKCKNHHFQIVWVNNSIYPFNDSSVKTVKRLSPMYYYYLSRAAFWINNQNFPYYINKHKHTTYIQTWHGTPLKKMLNDVPNFKGKESGYKSRMNTSIKRWDYLISPSPYATQCFKSAFNFKKEILEIGYPRNDILHNMNQQLPSKIKIIKQRLGIPSHKKVLLYAPTFRDDEVNLSQKHTMSLHLDLYKLKQELGNKYVLLLRPHIIISNSLEIDETLSDFAINVAHYNDISELYLISDICITDYSSVMFDFANTKKPLLFYAYDLDYYRDILRGFYLNFEEEVPGPISQNQYELISHIKNIETISQSFEKQYKAFYDKYCTYETGHAAQSIVDRFFK